MLNNKIKTRIMEDKVFQKGGMNIHYLEKMLGDS
jgi:acetyl-CoA carboxylase biotin carboxylase subunit